MKSLLDAVAAVVMLVSPEKVAAIAGRIRSAKASNAASALNGVVGTPMGAAIIEQMIETWRSTSLSPAELASMLVAGGHVFQKVTAMQTTELVWTGPTTPFVSARRTEQALIQVIDAARKTLFVTSFVAYDVSTVVQALNRAAERGVNVSMLLESSQEHGGSITMDVLGKMRNLVPTAYLYAWKEKAEPFVDGRVHAKVAVADGNICFITSANLTRFAMERNMEAGVLISGGRIPRLLDDHLRSLVDTKIISPV